MLWVQYIARFFSTRILYLFQAPRKIHITLVGPKHPKSADFRKAVRKLQEDGECAIASFKRNLDVAVIVLKHHEDNVANLSNADKEKELQFTFREA